jgi:3-isopropylmalate/(R)-2-methylmalate dehydratase small subunit
MGASIFIRERMQPFSHYSGRAVSLPRANVDTDQIIPKQFLKRIERTGFGPALFYDWRFLADGSPNPAFEFNRPSAAGASILIAGPNFGCGSSREHAPWALADYGFRVIIAPSFADIFFGNCCQNGLLAVTLPEPDVQVLARRAEAGGEYIVSVDLVHRRVEDRQGFAAGFDFDPYRREMLLKGLDEIGKTLLEEPRIAAFERRRAALTAGGSA